MLNAQRKIEVRQRLLSLLRTADGRTYLPPELDELFGALEEREKRIEELEQREERFQRKVSSDAKQIIVLRAERDRLMAALERYGDHDAKCALRYDWSCNCGYEQALQPQEGK